MHHWRRVEHGVSPTRNTARSVRDVSDESASRRVVAVMRERIASYTDRIRRHREDIMSKTQDAKKAQKKAATKTPKEKKQAKKLKKEAAKRQ
ncbi:hypothetical protein [Caballeronia sp. M1242]|uniref:hypothetical protein n=1 Tax=Caballeronia sp. M1242 TaxID=2814653 RepID=UPI0019CFA10C|nr:hypothetical protein [Caballeronia sp. M1242]QSN64701.1 hypothetical protein JYK05_21155 [Caballeronia sp. M1242]